MHLQLIVMIFWQDVSLCTGDPFNSNALPAEQLSQKWTLNSTDTVPIVFCMFIIMSHHHRMEHWTPRMIIVIRENYPEGQYPPALVFFNHHWFAYACTCIQSDSKRLDYIWVYVYTYISQILEGNKDMKVTIRNLLNGK